MKYTISQDRATLTIEADAEDVETIRELKEDREGYGDNQIEFEALDSMIANSELQWINPADTGDLTEAPMLGIMGTAAPSVRHDHRTGQYFPQLNGRDLSPSSFDEARALEIAEQLSEKAGESILERWAFMDYQTRSFCDDLIEKGFAVFTA